MLGKFGLEADGDDGIEGAVPPPDRCPRHGMAKVNARKIHMQANQNPFIWPPFLRSASIASN
jgi:hypothetical protein